MLEALQVSLALDLLALEALPALAPLELRAVLPLDLMVLEVRPVSWVPTDLFAQEALPDRVSTTRSLMLVAVLVHSDLQEALVLLPTLDLRAPTLLPAPLARECRLILPAVTLLLAVLHTSSLLLLSMRVLTLPLLSPATVVCLFPLVRRQRFLLLAALTKPWLCSLPRLLSRLQPAAPATRPLSLPLPHTPVLLPKSMVLESRPLTLSSLF